MADDTMMANAEAAARALLDRRIELIRELTAATSELEPLQRAAAEGEQRVLNAWTEALAGGWTADELKQLGLPEPDRKAMTKKTPPKQRGGSGVSAAASTGTAPNAGASTTGAPATSAPTTSAPTSAAAASAAATAPAPATGAAAPPAAPAGTDQAKADPESDAAADVEDTAETPEAQETPEAAA